MSDQYSIKRKVWYLRFEEISTTLTTKKDTDANNIW